MLKGFRAASLKLSQSLDAFQYLNARKPVGSPGGIF